MPRLTIDDRSVEVDKGATILDAAEKLGIPIPTMCFLKGCTPLTSCMLCVVRVEGMNGLVPACATVAEEGMQVETVSEQIHQARVTALELLLSDHVGDCMGPCHTTCPARMNIPLMIRQIGAGRLADAIATVKEDIALPAVLGRICPAPCERACRRAQLDDAVSICLLKRYVADVDLQSSKPYSPPCDLDQDKRVAIVGAGPAGLAAAYYLRQNGFGCTIFDDHDKPGGMLQYGVPDDELPKDVLDKEIDLIFRLGVDFQAGTRIGAALSLADLQKDFDAVFLAVGLLETQDSQWLGLELGPKGIQVNAQTYQTKLPGIFAGGDAVRKRKLAVRAVADGKEAVVSIAQFLSGLQVTGPDKPFNTRIGRLTDGEIERFAATASTEPLVTPDAKGAGFTDSQARDEAARCLHCDCRKPDACKLRHYAHLYGARPGRYKDDRRPFVQHLQHPDVIFEPAKCIHCGLCIQIASEAGEALGLTFIGRGFDVQVTVPFDRSIAEGLKSTAAQCVTACPTGALAFKEKP
jgi:NADPH-dependent glutamate synthase beta subunit-like oxidoreductase/ferredoxin